MTRGGMTLAAARDILRPLGLSISRTEWHEYRVAFRVSVEPDRARREATAYYTEDLDDAVGTGRMMATQRK